MNFNLQRQQKEWTLDYQVTSESMLKGLDFIRTAAITSILLSNLMERLIKK